MSIHIGNKIIYDDSPRIIVINSKVYQKNGTICCDIPIKNVNQLTFDYICDLYPTGAIYVTAASYDENNNVIDTKSFHSNSVSDIILNCIGCNKIIIQETETGWSNMNNIVDNDYVRIKSDYSGYGHYKWKYFNFRIN